MAPVDVDPMSGIPSLEALKDELLRAEAEADRIHSSAALLMIRLDELGRIVGENTPETGRAILRAAAARLDRARRPYDFVAQTDENTFAVLLRHMPSSDALCSVANRLSKVLRVDPISLQGSITCPLIGIAIEGYGCDTTGSATGVVSAPTGVRGSSAPSTGTELNLPGGSTHAAVSVPIGGTLTTCPAAGMNISGYDCGTAGTATSIAFRPTSEQTPAGPPAGNTVNVPGPAAGNRSAAPNPMRGSPAVPAGPPANVPANTTIQTGHGPMAASAPAGSVTDVQGSAPGNRPSNTPPGRTVTSAPLAGGQPNSTPSRRSSVPPVNASGNTPSHPMPPVNNDGSAGGIAGSYRAPSAGATRSVRTPVGSDMPANVLNGGIGAMPRAGGAYGGTPAVPFLPILIALTVIGLGTLTRVFAFGFGFEVR